MTTHPSPQELKAHSSNDFVRGAQSAREMLARFVEQGGTESERNIATSIRANWHPGWGDDPGQPPEVRDTWEPPFSPEGEAAYREYKMQDQADEDWSPKGLMATAKMLVEHGYPLFPANPHGQVPFVRALLESAVNALIHAATRPTPPPDPAAHRLILRP